jgi:predicted 2-oxoglutarate/Fe(II)-dependent dioxygenase YbiX
MNGHIKTVEGFLSIDECDYILTKCKNELKLSSAEVTNGYANSRKSSVGWINDLEFVNEKLTNLLKNSYNINGAEVTGLGTFQFTEYKIDEYFDWHTDRDSKIYKERFVSIVIQLNNNYTGGIFEIKNNKGELVFIEQKIGNLIMFDSGLRHRVTSVESGVRYSLVNWVSLIKTDIKNQNLI